MNPDRCQRTEDLVHKHLNGTISELEERALFAHLATCTACLGRYELLCSVEEDIRTVFTSSESSPPEMPDELRRRTRKYETSTNETILIFGTIG
jgi:anti-sigma factor RsiW